MLKSKTSCKLFAFSWVLTLFVSACAPLPPSTARPATEAEIVQIFSGNFFGSQSDGVFYGADKQLKTIFLEDQVIGVGTWYVRTVLGVSYKCYDLTLVGIRGGEVSADPETNRCFAVKVTADGAVWEKEQGGTGGYRQFVPPVKGFPYSIEYASLKRKYGL